MSWKIKLGRNMAMPDNAPSRRRTSLMFRAVELRMPLAALSVFLALCFLGYVPQGFCLTNEGLALIAFRRGITVDPYGILSKWSEAENNPCNWSGVSCSNDRVVSLELSHKSLEGNIDSALSDLSLLQILDLRGNKISGSIPEMLGKLKALKILNLSDNKLSGQIPKSFQSLSNLNTLCLAHNSLEGAIPTKSNFSNDASTTTSSLCNIQTLDLSENMLTGQIPICMLHHPSNAFEGNCLQSSSGFLLLRSNTNCGRMRSLMEEKKPAAHHRRSNRTTADSDRQIKARAAAKKSSKESSSSLTRGLLYALPAIGGSIILLAVVIAIFFYKRRTAAVSPWKAGMSGHLQKAFMTDVPSLKWGELQAACEDFSNIIGSSPDSIVFKGTLSNGTEVAVTRIRISVSTWSASSEIFFRRKIEALARMNDTHLVNLVGYCAEEDPFMRMLVFEYAPNGTVFEHLHNEDADDLEWSARMRIIVGAAYGLAYMHHDLVPPASHSCFDSNAIYLSEDYAAKLAEFGMSKIAVIKSDRRKSFSNTIGYDDLEGSDRHAPDFESNVFSFGIFLLEMVSGRLPYNDKEGNLLDWAMELMGSGEEEYMVEKSMVVKLGLYEREQLKVICEVVKLCVQSDPSKRPTMKLVAAALSKGLGISSAAACPKASPLLWAELEILSEYSHSPPPCEKFY